MNTMSYKRRVTTVDGPGLISSNIQLFLAAIFFFSLIAKGPVLTLAQMVSRTNSVPRPSGAFAWFESQ